MVSIVSVIKDIEQLKQLEEILSGYWRTSDHENTEDMYRTTAEYFSELLQMKSIAIFALQKEPSEQKIRLLYEQPTGSIDEENIKTGLPVDPFSIHEPYIVSETSQLADAKYAWIRDNSMQCFALIPLFDAKEQKIGLVFAYDTQKPRRKKIAHPWLTPICMRLGYKIEQDALENALKKSERKYRLLIEKMDQGLLLLETPQNASESDDYKIIDTNPAFCKLLHVKSENVNGKMMKKCLKDLWDRTFEALQKCSLSGELNTLEIKPFQEYEYHHLEVTIYCPDVDMLAVIVTDITTRKLKEEELRYLATHDMMTGLYNRSHFDSEKERLDEPEQYPLSFIMADVNGLKLTNDIFGHEEGDKLLKDIAGVISRACRRYDVVARTGGDEFCILLPNTTTEQAEEICHSIMQSINSFEMISTRRILYPGLSLGVATKEHKEDSFESVKRQAEATMYQNKMYDKRNSKEVIQSTIKEMMLEKSFESQEHIDRLIDLCMRLGERLHLEPQQLAHLEMVAIFHDIGKINVEKEILSKKEPLTYFERLKLRKYPQIGYRIAMSIPDLMIVADYILCAREHWDGNGYPQGISGEDIPLLSRIFAVADAYESMTQERPYRQALSKQAALMEIQTLSGKQFDPKVADVLLGLMKS